MSVSGTLTIEVSLDKYEIHLGSRLLKDAFIKNDVLIILPTEGSSNVVEFLGRDVHHVLNRMAESFIKAIGIRKFAFVYDQIQDHLEMLDNIDADNYASKDIKMSVQFFK